MPSMSVHSTERPAGTFAAQVSNTERTAVARFASRPRSFASRCSVSTSSLGDTIASGKVRTSKALIRVAPDSAASRCAALSNAPAAAGWSNTTRMTPGTSPGLAPLLGPHDRSRLAGGAHLGLVLVEHGTRRGRPLLG